MTDSGVESPAPPAASTPPAAPAKPSRVVFEGILAFSPNRDTLGGTAYLLQGDTGNILVDCPAWDEGTHHALRQQGGVRWLFLTHRGGLGRVKEIQQTLGCEVVIQEQEAYLLPEVEVTPFGQGITLSDQVRAIWTSGHSPGSSCLYSDRHGGVLFTGRHLLPNAQGDPVPLRISKTFHWPRQLQSIRHLLEQFSPATLQAICPGANTGFLRGQRYIDRAYERLASLDLEALLQTKPGL
ncbi:MAG TPA: MBL fold metallo-hydrolase [Chroococcidiopsis sp.]